MLPAFLTTILWSLSVISARRSIAAVGIVRANLTRLLLAVVVLGLYAHTLGSGFHHAGTGWFLLSGLVGMGLGDIAQFYALPLVGARLGILLSQCLAAPIAALAEWLWLGTTLSVAQVVWSSVILAGVAVAFFPEKRTATPVRPLGIVLGVLSAAGQGLGAVLSRKANDAATLAGQATDGISAAYLRILGGLVLSAVFFALWKQVAPAATHRAAPAARPVWRDYRWVVSNALCGAILGVSCYQWALRTTPSGVVLPIVACTPLVIVPFSYWLEGERPGRRSLAGALVAVLGAVALARVR